MKQFLAVYLGSPSSPRSAEWRGLTDAQRQEREKAGIKAWGDWVQRNQAAIVFNGTPLGKTKHVSSAGVADTKNNLTAYTVVRAESHEAAARLFEGHPHFTIFPGDSVEVMECLAVPGQ